MCASASRHVISLDAQQAYASTCAIKASRGRLLIPPHPVAAHPLHSRPQQAQALGNSSFILKNLSYDSVHRSDLFQLPCPPQQLEAYLARPELDVSPEQPWILQQFIQVCACVCMCHTHGVCACVCTCVSGRLLRL